MEADATYLRSYFGNPAAYNLRRLPWTGESLRFYRRCVSFDFRPTHRYLHDRRFYIFDRPHLSSLYDFSNFYLLLDSVKYGIKELIEKWNLFGIMRTALDNNLSNNLFVWIDDSQVVDRWLFSHNFSISMGNRFTFFLSNLLLYRKRISTSNIGSIASESHRRWINLKLKYFYSRKYLLYDAVFL